MKMILNVAALVWLASFASASQPESTPLRGLQASSSAPSSPPVSMPSADSADSADDGPDSGDRATRSICDFVCEQGACATGETEICHLGRTMCIDESGWNGHCRHSPRGQEDLCGACDGSSGGAAQRRNENSGNGIGPMCFSGETLVTVQDQGLTKMKDVSVGQAILTDSNEYEKVYAFGHYQPEEIQEMLEITATSVSTPLQVTSEHLMKIQDGSFVPAGSIRVGDKLTDVSTVTKIQTTQGHGLYAPLVASGSFKVQGSDVAASSYVAVSKADSVSHQDWVHFYLTPYRVFCQAVSPSLCQPQYNREASGIPHYIDMGMYLLDSVFGGEESSFSLVLQGLFLLVTVPVVLVLAAIEQLLNLSLVAKVLVGMTGLAARKMRTSTSAAKKDVKVL